MSNEQVKAIHSNVMGFFTWEDICAYRKIASRIKNGVIVEVGSYLGKSILSIADICRENNNQIYCVDTWMGSKEHQEGESRCIYPPTQLYNKFNDNIRDYGFEGLIIPIRMTSVEAAEKFKEDRIMADMVFLDAGHEYENISQDIAAWSGLLKDQGILCGHDADDPNIIRALSDYEIEYSQESAIWLSRKKGEVFCHEEI